MGDINKLTQNQIPYNVKTEIYKCEICDKEFKNNNGLKIHINVVHNLVKEHQCNICQRVFKLQSQLTSHVKNAHENKKNHKCDSCVKAFSTSQNLKRHICSLFDHYELN